MPRTVVEDSGRINLRIDPKDKALLARAVAYSQTDLTDFILRPALKEAESVVAKYEKIALSERDSLRVLEALESPPRPNAKLLAAARALPKESL